MENARMALQFLACDYMEKTYGKDWTKRGIVSPPITNAYIQGYKDKEDEDKTAKQLRVSQKRWLWFSEILKLKEEKEIDNVLGSVGKLFGIEIIKNDKMPDNIGAFLDGEGNVISFIDFKEIK